MRIEETTYQINSMDIYSIEMIQQQPKAIIIVIHGLATYTGIMRNYLNKLASYNYHICALDLPYHGKSTGEPKGWVPDFPMMVDVSDKYVDIINEKYNKYHQLPLFVLGHSMGGLIASTLANQKNEITGVIGSAPGYQINNKMLYYFYYLILIILYFFPYFYRPTVYSDAGFPRKEVRTAFEKDDLVIKKTYIKSMIELVKYGDINMKKDVHIPFLLYIGTKDAVVTQQGCEIKSKHLKHELSQFITYDNCVHCLYEENNLDIQLTNINNWVEKVISSSN